MNRDCELSTLWVPESRSITETYREPPARGGETEREHACIAFVRVSAQGVGVAVSLLWVVRVVTRLDRRPTHESPYADTRWSYGQDRERPACSRCVGIIHAKTRTSTLRTRRRRTRPYCVIRPGGRAQPRAAWPLLEAGAQLLTRPALPSLAASTRGQQEPPQPNDVHDEPSFQAAGRTPQARMPTLRRAPTNSTDRAGRQGRGAGVGHCGSRC